MKGSLLLDVVVRKGAAILELLASEDETLLVGWDALLVLDLGLDVVNSIRGLHLEGDSLARHWKYVRDCSCEGAHADEQRQCERDNLRVFTKLEREKGLAGCHDSRMKIYLHLHDCGNLNNFESCSPQLSMISEERSSGGGIAILRKCAAAQLNF